MSGSPFVNVNNLLFLLLWIIIRHVSSLEKEATLPRCVSGSTSEHAVVVSGTENIAAVSDKPLGTSEQVPIHASSATFCLIVPLHKYVRELLPILDLQFPS